MVLSVSLMGDPIALFSSNNPTEHVNMKHYLPPHWGHAIPPTPHPVTDKTGLCCICEGGTHGVGMEKSVN